MSELLTVTIIPKPAGFEPLSREVAELYGNEVYEEIVDDDLFKQEYVNTLQRGTTVAAIDLSGNIMGAGTLVTNPRGEEEITLLAVKSDAQGQELGKKIIKLIEDICVEKEAEELKLFPLDTSYSFFTDEAGFVPDQRDGVLVKKLPILADGSLNISPGSSSEFSAQY